MCLFGVWLDEEIKWNFENLEGKEPQVHQLKNNNNLRTGLKELVGESDN